MRGPRYLSQMHYFPSNWLISRRMAEINHSDSRNFFARSEFKSVGASERET